MVLLQRRRRIAMAHGHCPPPPQRPRSCPLTHLSQRQRPAPSSSTSPPALPPVRGWRCLIKPHFETVTALSPSAHCSMTSLLLLLANFRSAKDSDLRRRPALLAMRRFQQRSAPLPPSSVCASAAPAPLPIRSVQVLAICPSYARTPPAPTLLSTLPELPASPDEMASRAGLHTVCGGGGFSRGFHRHARCLSARLQLAARCPLPALLLSRLASVSRRVWCRSFRTSPSPRRSTNFWATMSCRSQRKIPGVRAM
ncbi:hypothetical protein B0J12DRAFT_749504 [Macrophomina phaseolina]|uniref:Uncharacterized protein n=1 Tax=Macrophomina phaseolina TaxID=35725 RepID=A0ABQ8GVG7_9PEZI|nr:hypothetical protein B0J12DRAFT_749504 [Macrophomina phaseolina]